MSKFNQINQNSKKPHFIEFETNKRAHCAFPINIHKNEPILLHWKVCRPIKSTWNEDKIFQRNPGIFNILPERKIDLTLGTNHLYFIVVRLKYSNRNYELCWVMVCLYLKESKKSVWMLWFFFWNDSIAPKLKEYNQSSSYFKFLTKPHFKSHSHWMDDSMWLGVVVVVAVP